MELPKRLYVVADERILAGASLDELPPVLLMDGAEVGIYLLRRIKKVEITRKLKAIEGEAEEPELEQEPLPLESLPLPLEPETVPG